MFTLRIIEETRKNENAPFEQVVTNHALGNSYSRLRNGVTKEFDQVMEDQYPEFSKNEIESLICSDLGDVFFVEKPKENITYSYFIMSENGKTFERL